MYFEHSKKNYYRFPSKNSVTDFDVKVPFYFPTKGKFGETDYDYTPAMGSHSFFTDGQETEHYENTIL